MTPDKGLPIQGGLREQKSVNRMETPEWPEQGREQRALPDLWSKVPEGKVWMEGQTGWVRMQRDGDGC